MVSFLTTKVINTTMHLIFGFNLAASHISNFALIFKYTTNVKGIRFKPLFKKPDFWHGFFIIVDCSQGKQYIIKLKLIFGDETITFKQFVTF